MARKVKIPSYCQICRKKKLLSDDHVPPRGCNNRAKILVKELAPPLRKVDERIKQYRRQSQGGLRFKTVCEHCNNTVLGSEYDPTMNEFVGKVGQIVRVSERLELPQYLPVNTKPVRLAKAVVGHMLAGIDVDTSVLPTPTTNLTALRKFVLEPEATLRSGIGFYFWPYRGDRIVCLRGVVYIWGFAQVSPAPKMCANFLKFFPIAFCLAYTLDSPVREKFEQFKIDLDGLELDDEVDLLVPTKNKDAFAADWPETPPDHDHGVLVVNDKACLYGYPQKSRQS